MCIIELNEFSKKYVFTQYKIDDIIFLYAKMYSIGEL